MVLAAPAVVGGGAAAGFTATVGGGAAAAAASSGFLASAAAFTGKILLSAAISHLAQSLLVRSRNNTGDSNELLGLPVNHTDSGPPRVWAIGQRVRVPAQVMWQARKVRESSATSKGKGGFPVRHVSFDCAFMLNDRVTRKLSQLIANDG